jgi:selenocysteine lyase/cysteine desulfurase
MLTSDKESLGVISVTVREGTIGELSRALYGKDIAVRSGFHCAPWAHRHLQTVEHGGAIRFSVGYATTQEDIEKTIAVVKEELYG